MDFCRREYRSGLPFLSPSVLTEGWAKRKLGVWLAEGHPLPSVVLRQGGSQVAKNITYTALATVVSESVSRSVMSDSLRPHGL